MKRFFAFGCSYTSYHWPTWADYVGMSPEFDEAYNFGMSGGGNTFIATRILNAHRKFTFTSDDVVAVCWTTVNREDRIKDTFWVGGGNVFNHHFYDDAFLDKYWDFNDALMKTASAILTANIMLESIGVERYFTSILGTSMMFDEYKNNEFTNYDARLLEYTRSVVDDVGFVRGIDEDFANGTSVFKIKRPLVKVPSIGKQRYDHHPSPKQHYEWVNKYLPQFVSRGANSLMLQYQQLVDSIVDAKIMQDKWYSDKRNSFNMSSHGFSSMLL